MIAKTIFGIQTESSGGVDPASAKVRNNVKNRMNTNERRNPTAICSPVGMGAVIYFSRGTFRVTKGDLIRLILIGGIVSLHWLAFFGSARVSNVSVSLVGFATNSLWAALLEPWFNKKKQQEQKDIRFTG